MLGGLITDEDKHNMGTIAWPSWINIIRCAPRRFSPVAGASSSKSASIFEFSKF
jgi:hypothetical protein